MKTTTLVLTGLIAATLPLFGKTPLKSPPRADYIAHEWGTFTSVQGSDGAQLEWNPFVVEELPKFVYGVAKPQPDQRVGLPTFINFGKNGLLSRQRMETPVIYFYADEPQKVDVEVSFPQGRFTEWFPQLAPGGARNGPFAPMRGAMRWADVQIIPGNGADVAQHFPKDDGGSHYYAARETDASAVRVKGADGAVEHEKFLFYRGVAQWEAPLRVMHRGDHAEKIILSNTGVEKLGCFFVYAVRGGQAALVKLDPLAAGTRKDIDFPFEKLARPAEEVRKDLAAQMRQALVSGGLYEREASAMVKTWDESWFGEQGTRVLYLLPQKWSDAVLPLALTPAPKELKRVFVGRAEIITPAQEWTLLKEIVRYAEGGSLERRAAIATVKGLGLGRFAEAAGRKLQVHGPQAQAFTQAAYSLLEATSPAARPNTTETTASR